VDARRDETRDVGHVREVVGVGGVGRLLDLLPLDRSGVRRVTRDDDVGVELLGLLADLVVVEGAALGVDLVLLDLEQLAGEVRRVTVREVTAVGQVQRENLVAGVQHGEIDAHVRLGARMGLDVDVVAAPQFLRPLDGEFLDLVGVLTARVVACAGVALGVHVRQRGALGLHDRLAGVVLAGDHLQGVSLSLYLAAQGVCDPWIDFPDGVVLHVGTSGVPRV